MRYALRSLRRSPGFTLFAVLTIALGIGAASTIFSVINSVLLSPLPYSEPDRLVAVWENDLKRGNSAFHVSPATFLDWRERNDVFTAIAASGSETMAITGNGEAEQLVGAGVTRGYFDVLGIQPALGRAFTPDEDSPAAGHVVLLSDGLWRRRFGSDRMILGSSLQLNGSAYTVVGVMPPSVRMPSDETEFWIPMAWSPEQAARRGGHYLQTIARLKADASLERAQKAMIAIGSDLERDFPNFQSGLSVTVRPLTEDIIGEVRTPIVIVAGAVGFLLLICCVNVANLMLARVATRRREIAIRSAVGAGRGHIVRQLLAESVVVALIGGFFGVILAVWGTHGLAALGATEVPRLAGLGVDARVLVFAVLTTLVTGLLFGLAPALLASRADLNETLKDGTRGSSGGAGTARARQLLLVAEVAISLTLLVGAGLLMRSLGQLQAVDPGFRTDRLLTARIPLPAIKYDTQEKRTAFYAALGERLDAIPDVRGAAFATGLPFGGSGVTQAGYWIEGKTPRNDNSKVPVAFLHGIAGDYFKVLGIPLRSGRLFNATDRTDSPQVAIVNEALVRQHFGGEDPIGKRFQFGPDSSPLVTIVGVVGDVHQRGLATDPPPVMYVVQAQDGDGSMLAMVRSTGNPDNLVAMFRREVQALDPDVPLASVASMDALISESIARPRFLTALLGLFAGAALLLALVGIYGVVAYSVAQRTHEFGIRMALGADRERVRYDVVRQATVVTMVGIACGLVAALALSRLLSTLLFQVGAADPLTYGTIILLLLGVTVAASWIPARRATRVSPLTALRAD